MPINWKTDTRVKMKKTFIFILLLIVVVGILYADQEVEIISSVDKQQITIGDQVVYRVEVKYKPGIKINLPGLDINLGKFEILNYDFKSLERLEDGYKKVIYKYYISAYEVGELEIPPLEISYEYKGEKKKAASNPIKIKVVSVAKSGEFKDIKDIKDPVLPKVDYIYFYTLLAALGLIIVLLMYFIWKKKRSEEEIVEIEEEEIDYQRYFWERLQELFKKRLQLSPREFYFELDDIFRKYLSLYVEEDLMEYTTYEIMRKFSSVLQRKLKKQELSEIKSFMEFADLAKFAKFPVEEVKISEDYEFVKNFIEGHPLKKEVEEEKGEF